MENIRGKIALLTGGSRGLGPHIAGFLAKEGVNLALTARSEEGLKTTADNDGSVSNTLSNDPSRPVHRIFYSTSPDAEEIYDQAMAATFYYPTKEETL